VRDGRGVNESANIGRGATLGRDARERSEQAAEAGRLLRFAAEWAPERAAHDELLYLRGEAYAHTDRKGGWDVIERF
jgi:hypothetical protein